MRIKHIDICDFKGFYGKHEISLHNACKNLLVYGENGSGKTSLYQALQRFLDSSRDVLSLSDYKNIFSSSVNSGYVRLTLEDGAVYTWSEDDSQSNTKVTVLSDAAKTKRFLDYKSLLRTYFLTPVEDTVNIFDLLVQNILSESINEFTNRTILEEWRFVESSIPKRNTSRHVEVLQTQIGEFNRGLFVKLEQLKGKAAEILRLFDDKVEMSFDFAGVGYDSASKALLGQEIKLTATFHGKPLGKHQQFLNEARLSAIALSIYFAAALLEPPSDLRLLVLDDVLIGLDMFNRLPVLKVLKDYFTDYQLVLLTYDPTWFEVIRQEMSESDWRSVKFHCPVNAGLEIPILDDEALLQTARHYLANFDYKAAAVYMRSAFEACLKKFCERKSVSVKYDSNPRRLASEDFWRGILSWQKANVIVVEAALQKEVELYRRLIMNPLSHAEVVDVAAREVKEAIDVVERLEATLKAVK